MLALLLYVLLRDVPTTFKVTVETEGITFSPDSAPTSRLPFRRAVLMNGLDRIADSVDGSVEIADSVRVTMSRVALGPLGIKVESLDGKSSAGDLFDASEEWVTALGPVVEIVLPDIEERAAAGENIVIPLTGQVHVGSGRSFQTNVTAPLLRSGKVSHVRRTIFGKRSFDAGSSDLEAGDVLIIPEPLSPFTGFVVVDERPALNGFFTVQANNAQVIRGPDMHDVSVSFVEGIKHDPVATLLWALTAFFFIQPLGALTGMWLQAQYEKRNTTRTKRKR